MITPSKIDLVPLDICKTWLGLDLSNTDDDSTIQFLITGFSQYVLNKTGKDSLNSVNTYTEFYDGNNRARMFLRNAPIVSVISLTVNSYSIPQSTDTNVAGWYIEDSQKSLAFRISSALQPSFGIFPYAFAEGQGNIKVVYTAGYPRVPYDLQEAVVKVVGQNYKRKDWIDLASKAMSATGASGTTSYRSWDMPPEVAGVLDVYSRYARP